LLGFEVLLKRYRLVGWLVGYGLVWYGDW
jgi:hypothetical protein